MVQPINCQQPGQCYPCGYPTTQNNAVEIKIVNPRVNNVARPSVYDVPKKSIYTQDAMPKPLVIPQNVTHAQVYNAPQSVLPTETPPVPPQPIVVKTEEAIEKTSDNTEVEKKNLTIDEPIKNPVGDNIEEILAKLNSAHVDEQLLAIQKIAEETQNNPSEATKFFDPKVMEALKNIINRDTSLLKGPTPQEIELRQKALSSNNPNYDYNLSEREMAELNKKYTLYTVAILQKLFSSEMEKELAKDGVNKLNGTTQKLDLKDYPLINDVIKIAKDNENPMLRSSALAALLYIATPENKELLKTMFEQSQKDSDAHVQAVATQALSELAKI